MSITRAVVPLILAACCGSQTVAQEGRFGAWQVGVLKGGEGLYAATVNDSGGVLGQYCAFGNGDCVWLVANDIQCSDGSRHPVLVNAEAGASSQEILCMTVEGRSRYAFGSFAEIDLVIRGSRRIGIAFPMKDGHFSVNRFSLDGAAPALSFMRGALKAAGEQRDSTRDVRL